MPHENWPLGAVTELIPPKRERERERERSLMYHHGLPRIKCPELSIVIQFEVCARELPFDAVTELIPPNRQTDRQKETDR